MLLEKAIAVDPKFAAAYAWLSYTDGVLGWSPSPAGSLEPPADLERDLDALRKAGLK